MSVYPILDAGIDWEAGKDMSRRSRKYQKSNRAGRLCVTCIVLTLLAVMSVQIVRVYEKNQDYIAKEKRLTEQLEAETERQADLEEYKKYTQSQDYIEDVAKAKLGLVYKNEIVFKEKKE